MNKNETTMAPKSISLRKAFRRAGSYRWGGMRYASTLKAHEALLYKRDRACASRARMCTHPFPAWWFRPHKSTNLLK